MDEKLANRVSAPLPREPAKEREAKPLAELAAEQGITSPQDFDALFGAGADLWDNDTYFEVFLEELRESRRAGR